MRHCKPDLAGNLCAYLVNRESCEKAYDSIGYASADTGDRVVFGYLCFNQTIESVSYLFDNTLPFKLAQSVEGNPHALQLVWAEKVANLLLPQNLFAEFGTHCWKLHSTNQ